MANEFDVKLDYGLTFRTFFHSQFFCTPADPKKSFANQTVIVTGSNIGLGFEAARHFYRLNCAKLILAVRTVSKGEAAKEDIVRSAKHRSDGAEAIEVWPLDLSSTESTLAFAERAKSLPRLDVLVENAGIFNGGYYADEGFEQTVQVNVVSTFLLALSLLPKLEETKRKHPDASPHLEIVSSEGHRYAKFEELNTPDIYATLNEKSNFALMSRYGTTKLMEVLFVRELVSRLSASSTSAPAAVTVTLVNPGMCVSAVGRNANVFTQSIIWFIRLLLARSTEVGARTLVYGACAGPSSHGEMMSDGENQRVEAWIYSDMGKKAQLKLFEQTMKILEQRKPGIGASVGLSG